MHSHKYSGSLSGFSPFFFFFKLYPATAHSTADSRTGMFFHLLDFSGLILWSVAPAPGAKPFQITVCLVKTLAPGNRRHFGLSRGSQVSSLVLGGPTQVLAAPQFQQIRLFSVLINIPSVYVVYSLCRPILGLKNLPTATRGWQSRLLV